MSIDINPQPAAKGVYWGKTEGGPLKGLQNHATSSEKQPSRHFKQANQQWTLVVVVSAGLEALSLPSAPSHPLPNCALSSISRSGLLNICSGLSA